MKKIMFVCSGNTCRSPMAEGILKKKTLECEDMYFVCSCGLYANTGDNATKEAIYVMKCNYDIDISNHKAKNIADVSVFDMDLVLCMTNSHKQGVITQFQKLKDRVFTLGEYVKRNIDIRDPYGFGIEAYNECAKQIDEYLNLFLEMEDIK